MQLRKTKKNTDTQEKAEKKEKLKKAKKDKPKKIKKETVKTETKVPEIQKTATWEYAYDADLTIGETKISNTAKVILIVLLLLIAAASTFAYLNKEYVIDYIKQPKVLLTASEVTLEVGDEFNYKDYLVETEYLDRYDLTYPKNSEVDTKRLGDYELDYKLVSLNGESVSKLLVHVVDTTPPEIELSETVVQLERGEQTEKFDCKTYVKSIKDNYDAERDLELLYPEVIDWTQDTIEIGYSLTDKSGNSSAATLTLLVNDKPKEPEVVYTEEPSSQPTSSESSSGGSSNSGYSGGGSSSSSSSGGSSYTEPAPTYTEPEPTPAPAPATSWRAPSAADRTNWKILQSDAPICLSRWIS